MARTRSSKRNSRSRSSATFAPLEKYRYVLTSSSIFFIIAFALGGAGVYYPILGLITQLSAIVCLTYITPRFMAINRPAPLQLANWLIIATLALPLLQIIPLPLKFWEALPGHELAASLASQTGLGGWRAWSLAPDKTLKTALDVLPAAAAFIAMAYAAQKQRLLLIRIIIGFGVFNALIAILQFASGDSFFQIFSSIHLGVGTGLFVNRNHLATFLEIAIILSALPEVFRFGSRKSASATWIARTASIALLSMGVLASVSRTGVTLLPVALIAAILLSWKGQLKRSYIVGALATLCLGVATLWTAPPVRSLIDRFGTASEDKRFEYWSNTSLLAQDGMPLGSGFGTFTLLYPTVEPLNEVGPAVVNHAHNDYLELLMEGGVPAIVLLLAWLVFCIWASVKRRGDATTRFDKSVAIAVPVSLILILAASALDYPVRMTAIAVLLGALVGLLMPIPANEGRTASKRQAIIWRLAGAGIALLCLSSSLSATFVLRHNGTAAIVAAPWSSVAHSLRASELQQNKNWAQSSRSALTALSISPLDSAALRSEAMARIELGKEKAGMELMAQSAQLGWRDEITQIWLLQQGLNYRAPEVAIQRADALLRQQKLADTLLPLLPPLLASKEGRNALATQLSYKPGWRLAFMNQAAKNPHWSVEQMVDFLHQLKRQKAATTVAETSLIRAVLADDGLFTDAKTIWLASGGQGLLGDPLLTDQNGPLLGGAPPYAWRAPAPYGVKVEALPPTKGKKSGSLLIRTHGLETMAAISQTILLPTGQYKVSLTLNEKPVKIAQKLSLSLECRSEFGDLVTGGMKRNHFTWTASTDKLMGQSSITVPSNCPVQNLTINAPENSGAPYTIEIINVGLSKY